MSISWFRDREFGDLGTFELTKLSFLPQRIYWITNFVPGVSRGHHAHLTLKQAFIVLKGSVEFTLYNGEVSKVTTLKEGDELLIIPSVCWRTFRSDQSSTVLLVICDQPFDESDYIRNWEKYLDWHKKNER